MNREMNTAVLRWLELGRALESPSLNAFGFSTTLAIKDSLVAERIEIWRFIRSHTIAIQRDEPLPACTCTPRAHGIPVVHAETCPARRA